MKALQFIELANMLLQEDFDLTLAGDIPEEWALARTAINRAWLGAEHYAKQVLREFECHDIADSDKSHTVWRYLTYCCDQEVGDAGSMGSDLYSSRLAADYRLDDGGFDRKQTAHSKVSTAEEIVDKLKGVVESCKTDQERATQIKKSFRDQYEARSG